MKLPAFVGAAETTVFFLLGLTLFLIGILLASKYVLGPVVRPVSQSLGAVMEAA